MFNSYSKSNIVSTVNSYKYDTAGNLCGHNDANFNAQLPTIGSRSIVWSKEQVENTL